MRQRTFGLIICVFLLFGVDARHKKRHPDEQETLTHQVRNTKYRDYEDQDFEFLQLGEKVQNQDIIQSFLIQIQQLTSQIQAALTTSVVTKELASKPAQLIGQIDSLLRQIPAYQKNTFLSIQEDHQTLQQMKDQITLLNDTLIKFIQSQKVENPQEQGELCSRNLRKSVQQVCSICETDFYYKLDEDNWYLIGLAHGFKKEFQALLERTKTNVGSGTFFLAFSKMNEICLSTDDSSEKVNIDKVLNEYFGRKISEYQMKSPLFQFPSQITPQYFFVKAIFGIIFKLIFEIKINETFHIHIRNIQLSEKELIKFNKEANYSNQHLTLMKMKQDNVQINYYGQTYIQSKKVNFDLQTQKGKKYMESINFGLVLSEHLNFAKGLSEQYLSETQRNILLQQMTKGEARLELKTEDNEDEMVIEFELIQ